MAMSPLPAVTSSQPSGTQGGKPAQGEQPADGFARLFAQASQPGKAGGAEGASRSETHRPADAQADKADELDLALVSDETRGLMDAAHANAAGAPGGEPITSAEALATLLASASTGNNLDAAESGLAAGLGSDELAGIRERLDTLARFRDDVALNPLGQAIAQVQQASQQGGIGNSLLNQANGGSFRSADPSGAQATLLGAGETLAGAGHTAKSGPSGASSTGFNAGGANPGGNDAGLNWTQQLQTQAASTLAAAGGTQPDAGDWLSSVSETLATARSGAAETSNALPLHTATLPGAGQSAATASASVAQTPTLSAPLASAEWQQSLGQQLVNLQQRGDQRVQLHLHPAELGPLSIHLKVDDQMAQAQFMSANPHVRAAVEQAIPQLREALGEAGIQLGEAMVGDQQQGQDQHPDGTAETGRIAGTLAPGTNDIAGDTLDDGPLGDRGGIALNGVDLYA
ncbi:flagellar hook-length control protein FliK [Modicisalibacter radicis]|uniref:flagellar hook-length control protein FliK n=1 Tax=Halomonas sp. EAR18 TaxID=2518972 RepID=UPI00109CA480|nr:flagellar hook-length control protein FliK [Halomonas sp. EAR18]